MIRSPQIEIMILHHSYVNGGSVHKNGGSFQFVLCKRLPEALFIRVLIVISSHPVPSSPPVASNRPGSCSPQSLEPLRRNRPARAHRPHTVWGRNRSEERTW